MLAAERLALVAGGWGLADKSQKAKKASGVNPTQKRRTTPLLSGASGVGCVLEFQKCLNFRGKPF
jgi:hypothetical protein